MSTLTLTPLEFELKLTIAWASMELLYWPNWPLLYNFFSQIHKDRFTNLYQLFAFRKSIYSLYLEHTGRVVRLKRKKIQNLF